MTDKKRYFVREDSKLRLKEEYQKQFNEGNLTEELLHANRNNYYEQYRDFSVDTYNQNGVMYTVKSGFASFEAAKHFVLELRGDK